MSGSEILIGVTGGVAAYKTAYLVSQLVQSNARVSVVMTRSAKKFVGPTTFEALTDRPVHWKVFESADHPLGTHIELARAADVFCIAPATANFLAKAASGLADDLVSTLYLSCTCSVLVAPAMNNEMWTKPAVQRNVEQLQADGVTIIPPEEGWLSCRTLGPGRMADPETILSAISSALACEKTA